MFPGIREQMFLWRFSAACNVRDVAVPVICLNPAESENNRLYSGPRGRRREPAAAALFPPPGRESNGMDECKETMIKSLRAE